MTTILFDGLTKRFPGRAEPVLDGFSLVVRSGELVALLGPSGAGKSTLLKLVAGIERPDAGDLFFDGQSILDIAPNRRAAVLVFQSAYLFPFLSVKENIAFGLTVQRLPRAEISAEVGRMLDLVGLPGFEHRRPGELSGGEQQRVALARALVTRPRVLLLDEPFGSLDTAVRLDLQAAVQNIQHELGTTTILVTHDLDEAMAMSERMALLINGKVAACDRPNLLFQRPPCVESARFVGVTTFVRGAAGGGWIETGLGRLRIRDEAKTGQAVYAIRPEHIRLHREGGENALPGVVQRCVFRGEHMEYQVMLGDRLVRARVPAEAETIPHDTSVQVVFPIEHLFEVKEEVA